MKIGFIGLGIMGEAMCRNIVQKNDDPVYVFDFVKEKVDLLVKDGAIACSSSREAAEKADMIITMVPKSEHSRAVVTEVLLALNETKIYVDMSTIDPDVSVELSEMVKKTGADFLDAPVVKSRPAAEAGKKFTLDSKAPTGDYQAFLDGEVRYSALRRTFPDNARGLFAQGAELARERYEKYRRMAENGAL